MTARPTLFIEAAAEAAGRAIPGRPLVAIEAGLTRME
jgi:hypothetical protein